MKVMIKETGKIETLQLIDENGINWARDLIGNWDTLDDGSFIRVEGADYHVCEQDTYDWWVALLAKHQELDDRFAILKEKHGIEAVNKALRYVDYSDLEDHVNYCLKALDEAFPE